MKFKYVMGACALLSTAVAYANPTCTINNANNVLECAIAQNRGVLSSQAGVSVAGINKDISGRLLNPDLEINGGYGNGEDDGTGIVMGVAVMQTIETPTKRRAKKDKAWAALNEATAGFAEQKEIVTIQVLTILNRLRQIEKEKSALNETISTFSSVVKKYQAQSALSYEDRVSTDLFKLALNNYQIEKNQLMAEEKSYKANLQSILNTDVEINKRLFLYAPRSWPAIGASADIEKSVDMAMQQAVVDKSKADFLDAKSSSFGAFSVGPYVDTKPGKPGTADEYGLKFSLPIPLYSNKAASSAGRVAYQNAQDNLHAKKKELVFTYNSLLEQYKNGTKALKNFGIGNIENKHKQTEKLFDTGRVSSSVLIEAHRQVMDSIRIYYQYELETLQSLWKLYALQGKLLTNMNEVYYAK